MGTNSREVGAFALAVAAELRAGIARAGLSQRKMAELAEIPLSTLNKTLSGARVADVEDVFAIATYLQLDPSEIIEAAEKTYLREEKAARTQNQGGGLLRAAASGRPPRASFQGERTVTDATARLDA